jgi:hypothetical protein
VSLFEKMVELALQQAAVTQSVTMKQSWQQWSEMWAGEEVGGGCSNMFQAGWH